MEYVDPQSPSFTVNAESVRVLHTPDQFYQLILERIRTAQRRVYLSSLYLGTGDLEKTLVEKLCSRLDNQPNLEVVILLDYLRGTRGERSGQSSTTLLRNIAHKAKVYLFHTPDLRGFTKKLLSERTNEIIGLQHMKLYIFDDSVLISGANLSDTYFTNRQDRYVLIENCPSIVDYFVSVIQSVGSSSFVLNGDGTITLSPSCSHHPFQGDSTVYRSEFRDRVMNANKSCKSATPPPSQSDTVIVPLIQMGQFAINEEHTLLKKLFASKDKEMRMTIASGYLNMTDEYEELVVQGGYPLDIVMASPEANGFAGAKGLTRYVPSMYTSIASSFLQSLQSAGRDNVQIREWSRPDWSFHAKGIWCDYGSRVDTIIGSSNYGYRSVHRDLEAQIVLSTTNEGLMSRLREERDSLLESSRLVDSSVLRRVDHYIPPLVPLISRFIRHFF